MNINMENYYQKREFIFKKIQNSSNIEKVLIATIMACFTGLMAQIIIPLPWTPVPITGQTFAFLVSGLILGKKYGGLSQVIYILGGIVGISWFSGMTSGIGILLGSDGGYLIGGILVSMFIGHFAEKYNNSRKFKKMFIIMIIANFVLIYIPGLTVLGVSLYLSQGVFPSIGSLFIMGLAPFVIGDIFKIWGAATLSKVVLPKK